MFINPAIIGLLLCALLSSLITLYASIVGIRILRHWDLQSGSEQQLLLERQTYLISTIVSFIMGCELLSLFLFIATADHLHTLFAGAMCAAGTLFVNQYGYPTLTVKLTTCILAGLWLIINNTDNLCDDYPLIKFKYSFLLLICAGVLLETWLLCNYFINLDPQIITSCCGSLFSDDQQSIAGELAHLSPLKTRAIYVAAMLLTTGVGVWFIKTGKGALLFSLCSTGLFFLSLLAVISFISLYYYELPTHHCPFCILQPEYYSIGYPLYMTLILAVISGGGVGLLTPFQKGPRHNKVIHKIQKRLCFIAIIGHIIFIIISFYPILFSDFRIE